MFTKKQMREMYKGVNLDFTQRWEDGVEHHPKSLELAKHLESLDFLFCGDALGWKFGGDGDNGEALLYSLDCYFERLDLPPLTEKDRDGLTFSNGYMGNHNAWCYWSTEYPDEGSCGPFDSEILAIRHASLGGCWEYPENPYGGSGKVNVNSFKAGVAEFASKLDRVPEEIRAMSGVPSAVVKELTLEQRLQLIADKEEGPRESGGIFGTKPTRWWDNRRWRCAEDHVSGTLLHTETGNVCIACRGEVWLTFPEDKDGPLDF